MATRSKTTSGAARRAPKGTSAAAKSRESRKKAEELLPSTPEGICYARNFLAQVILKADFTSAPAVLSREMPSALRKLIQADFPVLEPRDIQTRSFRVPGDPAKNMESHLVERYPEWLFHSDDRAQTFGISRESVWLMQQKYSRFDQLRDRFTRVFTALPSQEEIGVSRLGLRYINILESREGNALDWSGLIDPRLLSSLQFSPGPSGARLARYTCDLTWSVGGDRIRLRIGMPNPDFPAPIARRQFVVDLDASTHEIEVADELPLRIAVLHSLVQSVFEGVITGRMREVLGGESDVF